MGCNAMHPDWATILKDLKFLAELLELRDQSYGSTAESLAMRLKLNDQIAALEAEIGQGSPRK